MGLILFVIFILIPLIEIGLFVAIGGLIGVVPTMASVVLTALLGSALLRQQGLSTWRDAQTQMQAGHIPLDSVIHGVGLLIAGILLLTPGFFTDAIGFLLFVPPFRLALGRALIRALQRSGQFHINMNLQETYQEHTRRDGRTIDGEAEEVDPHDR